jgi:hypothetical protein
LKGARQIVGDEADQRRTEEEKERRRAYGTRDRDVEYGRPLPPNFPAQENGRGKPEHRDVVKAAAEDEPQQEPLQQHVLTRAPIHREHHPQEQLKTPNAGQQSEMLMHARDVKAGEPGGHHVSQLPQRALRE